MVGGGVPTSTPWARDAVDTPHSAMPSARLVRPCWDIELWLGMPGTGVGHSGGLAGDKQRGDDGVQLAASRLPGEG